MEKLINDFKISFTKGDTYALAVKFKNLTEDLRTAFFTVKETADDEPLLQKSLGAGISKIDDRVYKAEKTYKLQIQAEDTANLEPRVQYLYDLQVAVGNVVKTVIAGVFVVNQSMSGTASTTTSSLEVLVDDELQTEVMTVPATQGIEYEQDPVALAKIGDLTGLSTTAKETIVQAINEVKNGNTAVLDTLTKVLNGTTPVPKASTADNATSSTQANHALTANHATTADSATEATHATTAEQANNATEANHALTADTATKVGAVAYKQLNRTNYESSEITEYGLYIVEYLHTDNTTITYQSVMPILAGSGDYILPIYNKVNSNWGEISFNWTDKKIKISSTESKLIFNSIRYIPLKS